MRRPKVHHGAPRQTAAQGRLQAKLMLVNARSVDMWTPESLAHCYVLPVREAEAMLSAERAKRGREGR